MARTRIFFVTDVHGSDKCFRKFINAAKFYKANVLILGGDIAAKVIVPFVKGQDGTYTYKYAGEEYRLKSQEKLDEMVKNIRDLGCYTYLVEPADLAEVSASKERQDALFMQLMVESIQRWMKLAEERLKGTGVKCYVSPGNDDPFEIDNILDSAPYSTNPEEKVVLIDGEHEMLTLGTANRTPWDTPREADEDVLQEKIDRMAGQVKDMRKAIFNFHVPPIDTVLDRAPKLDGDLRQVVSSGSVVMIPAGSTAVRKSIEKYQPMMGLHGHIHESGGTTKIGRTMCFNPGSEYSSGRLTGFLGDVEGETIKAHQLTAG
jgi:Icc-related predicted phosphoesterase